MNPGKSQSRETNQEGLKIVTRQQAITRALSPRLHDIIANSRRLLILAHNNPDPDAIASAAALRFLAMSSFGTSAQVAFGGTIGRVENQKMIRLLRLKMKPVGEINWRRFDCVALVDHQPRRSLQYLPDDRIPDIVIDHHPRLRMSARVRFADIRSGIGANSTILYQYLQEAGAKIPRFLATALCYGIQSDTLEFSRGTSVDDITAYKELFPLCNHKALRQITHPVRSVEYYRQFWSGMRSTRLWGGIAISSCGNVTAPDIVGEIADTVINIDGMRWAFSTGVTGETIYISIRTKEVRRDAGRLIRRIVGRRGSAGGHGYMAGAQVPRPEDKEKTRKLLERLEKRFLSLVTGTEGEIPPGKPFIESKIDAVESAGQEYTVAQRED